MQRFGQAQQNVPKKERSKCIVNLCQGLDRNLASLVHIAGLKSLPDMAARSGDPPVPDELGLEHVDPDQTMASPPLQMTIPRKNSSSPAHLESDSQIGKQVELSDKRSGKSPSKDKGKGESNTEEDEDSSATEASEPELEGNIEEEEAPIPRRVSLTWEFYRLLM